MKLSDYVIDFLVQRGVSHFFGISGGAAVHLFDSVAKHPNASYICPQHEQSAAVAADGYARATGKMGAAMTTSGPGATNLLTGVCCSYYDSVPTFMITGQVATFRLKGDSAVRQIGFQETDVPSIFQSVTKYVAQVKDPQSIRYHMEKAFYLAHEGRPGPVLIDLPDDLQRVDVDPDSMMGFTPPAAPAVDLAPQIDELLKLVSAAARPVLVLGGGLKTPPIPQPELIGFVDQLGLPVLVTWAATDLIPASHPLRVGTFGVYGPRAGNFTIQNADLVITLGTRLSQNVTGGILSAFAREAFIAMVDVDAAEMSKFDGRGISVGLRIQSRAADFIAAVRGQLRGRSMVSRPDWLQKIRHWNKTFPLVGITSGGATHQCVDAYKFIDALSTVLPDNETIVIDTGGNLTWASNGLKTKARQTVVSAWNNTPMGYALPAAVGTACADHTRGTTCIIGDGGLMLSLGELATVVHHRLPVKVLLFNNHGHGIQRQTLETWLNGRYEGVGPESGLAFTDFVAVARAMGLKVINIDQEASMAQQLAEAYAIPGPVLCNIEIHPNQKLYPVLKYGAPLEDQLPSLDRAVLAEEMLVELFRPAVKIDERTGGAGV